MTSIGVKGEHDELWQEIQEFKVLLEASESEAAARISTLGELSKRLTSLQEGRFNHMFRKVCQQVHSIQQRSYDYTSKPLEVSSKGRSVNNTLIDDSSIIKDDYHKERDRSLNQTYDSLTSLDVDKRMNPIEAAEALSRYLRSVSNEMNPEVHNKFVDLLTSVQTLADNTPLNEVNTTNLREMVISIERAVGTFI